MTVTHQDIPWRSETAKGSLPEILHGVRALLHRYVVLNEHQATIVSLWIAHTHALTSFDTTPYLRIASAVKRSGKTRLLEVLEALVARPWLTGHTTVAALMRKVDAESPTVLLDESDMSFSSQADQSLSAALTGMLNTGYKRNGKHTVCVGQNANLRVQDFSTFSAKAIAGIGDLPGTVADRSIRIELRRRSPYEVVSPWRARDGEAEAAPYRNALARWATTEGVADALRSARPDMPQGLSDRQNDILEPLLAIADRAGAPWPEDARRAALALVRSDEDTDISIELLRDLVDLVESFADDEAIASDEVLGHLVSNADRPWADWRSGKPITARGLARLLGPLGAHPARHDTNRGRVRGYRVAALQDALERYLPAYVSKRPDKPTSRRNPGDGIRPSSNHRAGANTVLQPVTMDAGTHGHMQAGNEPPPGRLPPHSHQLRDERLECAIEELHRDRA